MVIILIIIILLIIILIIIIIYWQEHFLWNRRLWCMIWCEQLSKFYVRKWIEWNSCNTDWNICITINYIHIIISLHSYNAPSRLLKGNEVRFLSHFNHRFFVLVFSWFYPYNKLKWYQIWFLPSFHKCLHYKLDFSYLFYPL